MSEPWPQTSGFSSNTLSNPYIRLMNTSGINFKDHTGSMVSRPLFFPNTHLLSITMCII